MRTYCFLLFALFLAVDAKAQGVRVFRDSEVERVVKKMVAPILFAANVNFDEVKVFVVDEQSVNAYVATNNDIFIHAGLLQLSNDPGVVVGVIAHEICHISQQHLVKRKSDMRNSLIAGNIGYALGIIASAAVSPEVGQAVILGSSTVSYRNILAYSREQEEVADLCALEYLDHAGYAHDGLTQVFYHFGRAESRLVNLDEYLFTHPLSERRLRKISNYKRKGKVKEFSPRDRAEFERVVEKVRAFLMPVDLLDGQDLSLYMRSIVNYRKANLQEALEQLGLLIDESAVDPYLYEIRAQIFYKLGRVDEAIEDYMHVLKGSPDDLLIKLELAQVLLLKNAEEALQWLELALYQERDNPLVWKQLAAVYSRTGQLGMSYFALANKFFLEGDTGRFVRYARLSRKHLVNHSVQLKLLEDMEIANKARL